MPPDPRLEVWADGSGIATGGPGGWAIVLRAIGPDGEVLREREGSGPIAECTNQRAELIAVIQGLRALARPSTVTVYSDSEYVIHALAHGWLERWQGNGWLNREGEPVANRDLWVVLAWAARRHTAITWRHIKGHARTYECPVCGWAGDEPRRDTPKARTRWCPVCEGVRVETLDKYPANARCDELAGARRRELLPEAVAA